MRQALEMALEALEKTQNEGYNLPGSAIRKAITAIKESLAQPEQEPVAKLQVTLEDRPIDIELAQYKRMFEAACSELGAINEALGLDPNDGGAEPILFAIEQLRGEPQEPVACVGPWHDCRLTLIPRYSHQTFERDQPLYTTPPQRTWVGLTDEEIQKMRHLIDWTAGWSYNTFARAVEAKLKEKNT